ncbi:MAG: MarR family winged helix-turn-helix transcriptional regulator [Pygmaiobacter sp.]|jgi:MarR family transcriptional regulator for hemolysin|nr:MarR family winged helix-turn-helix transcriptional regulator [Pygmaiobacter sp.]
MLNNTAILQNVQLVMQLFERSASSLAQKYGLLPLEMQVLIFLINNPGKDTATDIVELRMLPKANVSKAVEGLIQKKLLLRRPDTADRRRIHLVLTPAGAAMTADVKAARDDFTTDLFAGFTQRQLDEYAALNARIVKNAHSALERK